MPERALTVTFLGNTAGLETAIKRTTAQLNGMQAAGRGMQSLGGSLTRNLTVPVVGLGVAAAAMAVKFEASMERLHTQAGVSQAAIAGLSRGVLNMAGTVGASPEQLATAMYHVASSLNATLPAATRSATELKVLKIAAEGAAVGHADLTDVTNALDAAVVSGIKGVQNFSGAMGGLNSIVGAGDMTMQNLADALSTGLLAPMKTYGLTLTDVGGALATFGDNNIRGQDAATKLISAVRIMAAPSKAAAKELAGLNLSTLQLAKDMRQGGLIQALQDLKTHMTDAGLTASQQGLVVARAFGGRQSTGVQILLSQLDRLQAKTKQVGDGANQFGQAWAATQQTAAFKIHAGLASMQADLTRFGDDVLPTLLQVGGTIVKDVDKVSRAFTSLPKGAQDAIITGGLVIAGIGPALKIVGSVTALVGRAESLAKLVSGASGLGKTAQGALTGGKGLTSVGMMEVNTLIAKTMIGGPGSGVANAAELAAGGGAAGAGTAGTAVTTTAAETLPGINALIAPLIAGLGTGVLAGSGGTPGGRPTPQQAQAGLPGTVMTPSITPVPSQVHQVHQALSQLTVDARHAQMAIALTGTDSVKAFATISNAARRINDVRFAFADTMAADMLKAKGVSETLIRDMLNRLRTLPAGARADAANTAIGLAAELQAKGKLPKDSAERIRRAVTAEFRSMRVDSVAQSRELVTGVAKNFDWLQQRLEKTMAQVQTSVGQAFSKIIGAVDGHASQARHAATKQASAATLAALGIIPEPSKTAAASAAAKIPPVAKIPVAPAPTPIPSQLVGAQTRMAELANQLAAAQNAVNTVAQKQALSAELKLEHTWLTADKTQLDRVNAALATGHVSLAKHKQLLQDKLAVLQEIGNVISNIGSTQQSLSGLAASAGAAGGFNLAPAGAQVKVPSIYDVRTAAGARHESHVTNHNTITLKIEKGADLAGVIDVLDRAVSGDVHARMRSAGMRGT